MSNKIKIFLWLLWGVCMKGFSTYAKTHFAAPGRDVLQVVFDRTSPGDTVVLRSGTYHEHDLEVNHKLVILGENFPLIDGEKKAQVFIINADSTVIEGLAIRNTGRSSLNDMAGIRIQDADHVVVRRNKLENTTYGVLLQNATYCVIEGNEISSHAEDEVSGGNGIHAWKCSDLTIENNNISGHRDGIYFEFVRESDIIGNHSEKNLRYGLHFMFSHSDVYRGNVFRSNGSGVAVMYSKDVTMEDNEFRENWGEASYGLLLKEISDSRIEENLFQKNTVGIYLEGTNRIVARRNQFVNNGWAMKITASCSQNTFEESNFIGNSFDVATNGTMVLNSFNNNFWDKYEGYDLDRNGFGDVPYYPVSVYAMITENIPAAMILYRSFLTDIMDRVEKVIPSIIPDQLKDEAPVIKKWRL